MKRGSVYFLADHRKAADPLGRCLGSHLKNGDGSSRGQVSSGQPLMDGKCAKIVQIPINILKIRRIHQD